MDIVDALDGTGLVCAVGAGGKKTTLYALARDHARAVVTATVRIPVFDENVAAVAVTDDPVAAVESHRGPWPLGVVPGRYDERRYEGYPAETVADVASQCAVDAVLVKADGARSRLLKAPGDHEPQLPASATTVVPIASARAVGNQLTEKFVHRPERVADITGRTLGDELRPEDVAAVLASERGGLKDVPAGATAVPVVNMCDTDRLTRLGRDIAEAVLARASVPRVVCAQMSEHRVVSVVQ